MCQMQNTPNLSPGENPETDQIYRRTGAVRQYSLTHRELHPFNGKWISFFFLKKNKIGISCDLAGPNIQGPNNLPASASSVAKTVGMNHYTQILDS